MSNRAKTVPVTAKIIEFHFCDGDNPKSLTTSGIKGTMPNHAKKQMKKAMAEIQNVLMGILLRFKRFNRVAFIILRLID
tara:strand:- start:225 stop:461 length:237 start_codon:yes stop_codon:yes gene_type:complete